MGGLSKLLPGPMLPTKCGSKRDGSGSSPELDMDIERARSRNVDVDGRGLDGLLTKVVG